jgi:formylglycine-generating enzyme required for sulfatase activity
LSDQDKIDESQWCYEPMKGMGLRDWANAYGEGMEVPADFLSRRGYRLPTGEEWEYACRAGSWTAWSMGDAEGLLRRYAWYVSNAESKSHPIGSLRPNDWGLFDMHGNLWEWCHDECQGEDERDIDDLIILKEAKHSRLLRGGAFRNHAGDARSDYRASGSAASRYSSVRGFRPARTIR